eukprot:11177125-Ditylum_brightwellii.AAC.1
MVFSWSDGDRRFGAEEDPNHYNIKDIGKNGIYVNISSGSGFWTKTLWRYWTDTLTSLILVEKVTLLIQHLQSNSSVGQQLQIMLDWAQLSAGTRQLLLEDSRSLPHLEGKWIPHLCKKLCKINAYIKVLDTWTQPSQSENNQHIMDILVNTPKITDTQVIKADYLRKFHSVTMLANTTTFDGTKIIPALLSGRQTFPQSKYIISNTE